LFFIQAALWLIFFVIAEFSTITFKKKEMAFKDEVRTMAVSEFENLVKKGKKIAILDKYVVDFT